MLSPLTGSLGPVWFPRKAAGTYEQKLLAGLTGIVAYWPLTPDRWAEGAGGIVDVGGNGRHGTNNGATPDAVDGPSAAMGRAPSFDGVNDYISVAHNAGLSLQALTVALWAKRVGNNKYQTWLAKGVEPNGNTNYIARIADTNRVDAFVGRAPLVADQIMSISQIDMSWHSVIFAAGITHVSLYLDDIEAATPVARTGVASTNTGALTLGRWASIHHLHGFVTHVLILDHAATADERALINDPN